MPKVSIILPTYNGAGFIPKAIESVLQQTYVNWELIIIADGSTDNTKQIVSSYANQDARIIFIDNLGNVGLQKTLNNGIDRAQGTYIARIDDDDEWIDINKLEKQIDFLETHEEYILIGTGAIVVNENRKEIARYMSPLEDKDIRNKILGKNCFLHSSVIVRKVALATVGAYSETAETRHIEDYDLWLRLGTIGKFANLRAYSIQWMDRESGITSKNRVEQARNMVRESVLFKKEYPRFFSGYLLSTLRLAGFVTLRYIPFGKKPFYFIKTIYKRYF